MRPATPLKNLSHALLAMEESRFTPRFADDFRKAVSSAIAVLGGELTGLRYMAKGGVELSTKKPFGIALAALLSEHVAWFTDHSTEMWDGKGVQSVQSVKSTGMVSPLCARVITQESSLEAIARRIEKNQLVTAYTSSPDNPDISIHNCSVALLHFDKKIMEKRWPIYEVTTGQPARLAVDQMIAHIKDMRREMFNAIAKMPPSEDVDRLVSAYTGKPLPAREASLSNAQSITEHTDIAPGGYAR